MTTTMTENSNTPAEQFALTLKKIKACPEAREWADGLDYNTAWNTCSNPLWMLFLIRKITPLTPIQNEILICRFAREVLHLSDDPRVLACIETREAWARGEASDEVREVALGDARDAAENTAESAACFAVGAAAESAVMDSAMDSAWAAAWNATRGGVGEAGWDARNAAWATAWVDMNIKQCDIIRELIPQPELK